MRRGIAVAGVVLVVTVLAVPAVRRGVGAKVGALADGVRARVAAFGQDYQTREAELRARMLPDAVEVAAAERTRRPHGADDETGDDEHY